MEGKVGQHNKYENYLKKFQNNMKHNNICIIGIPERKDKEKGIEKLFEKIMTKNSLTWRGERP